MATLLTEIFSTHFTQPAEIATILACERPLPLVPTHLELE
jgi:hypothetical protein